MKRWIKCLQLFFSLMLVFIFFCVVRFWCNEYLDIMEHFTLPFTGSGFVLHELCIILLETGCIPFSCLDYLSCLALLNSIAWATWAIWATIERHNLGARNRLEHFVIVVTLLINGSLLGAKIVKIRWLATVKGSVFQAFICYFNVTSYVCL